ncbi:hypothetical protein [Deinococcus sp. AJ005]|uniref:hypothetical protein n=1 Tax=Deinococcus sp. AJ005 TaxID=2652443 RepID=UPI00186574A4|nr:hypothetical protein [Deinococcus sp. AJ005]
MPTKGADRQLPDRLPDNLEVLPIRHEINRVAILPRGGPVPQINRRGEQLVIPI